MKNIGNITFTVPVYVEINSELIQASKMESFALKWLKISSCQLSAQELHLRYLNEFLIKIYEKSLANLY